MSDIPAAFHSGVKPVTDDPKAPQKKFTADCSLCGKPLIRGRHRFVTLGSQHGWPLAWHLTGDTTTCIPGLVPRPVTLVALAKGDHILGPDGRPHVVHECTPLTRGYRLHAISRAPVYLDHAHFFLVPDPGEFDRLRGQADTAPRALVPTGFRFPTHDSLLLTAEEIDALTPADFELFVASLLEYSGWGIVRRGGHANDRAADVLAVDREGVYVAVQCKHTSTGRSSNVGAPTMYQVNGTALAEHGATAALVVTNGGFTKDARSFAQRHRIPTIDRSALLLWAGRKATLHDLLSGSRP
ncbi:restriction endonuclease [Streptomyces sp. NPDC044571]|uniref:restriction endonuclease n=1 Tax=Streptomyces sp. NPDC044571 TaxID=3155371 RepID=UPI0033F667C9